MVNHRLFRFRVAARLALVAVCPLAACGPSNGGAGGGARSSGASSSGSSSGVNDSSSSGSGAGTGSPGSDGGNAGIHGVFLDSLSVPAQIVADSLGGLHVAGAGPSGLRYGYCASRCDQASSWGYADVAGAQAAIEADSGGYSLAVDGQGHPRVMTHWVANGTNYFECNGNCTSSASWTQATKLQPPRPSGVHFFAVSPQGVAAFAFVGMGGIQYASCPSNCTNAANWSETLAAPVPAAFLSSTTDAVLNASLAFDLQGRPRMTFVLAAVNNQTVGYAACDSGCNAEAGWQMVTFPTGALPSPLLALDASGNPRMVSGSTGAYSWCDSGCATSVQNWQGPISNASAGADWLAVDGQGDIHTVHAASPGVNYTWCAAGCTSSPQWQTLELPFTDLNAAGPAPAGSAWSNLGTASVAIDSTGTAAIALNAGRFPTGVNTPDAYGVFLWLVPGTASNPATSSSASASSGSTSGSSSSSASSSSSSDPLANFVGGAWSGSEATTATCGDAGALTGSKSISLSFQPTASGFTFTDASGCTWSFTVSGDTATLAGAPETCSIDSDAGTQVLTLSTGTLTTSDGHQLTGQFTGTETQGATTCAVVGSFTLTR
jgi:hypothetical protein